MPVLAGHAPVAHLVIVLLILLVRQKAQGQRGQRRAHAAAADVAVGDGHDGVVALAQVVQHHLVVAAQRLAQKLHQRFVLLQNDMHIRTPLFRAGTTARIACKRLVFLIK